MRIVLRHGISKILFSWDTFAFGHHKLTISNSFFIGVAIAGSGLNGHFSTLSNDELKKCVNTNGYVVAEASVKYHPWP